MAREVKKWWFLQRLENQIILHTGKEELETILNEQSTLSTKKFLIHGTKDYPGIAKRPWGHYLSLLRFWGLWESHEKYKRRVSRYMNLINQLKNEEYIDYAKTVDENGDLVTVANVPYLTSKGEDVLGIFGLSEMILKKYPLTWANVFKLTGLMLAGGICLSFTIAISYYAIITVNNTVNVTVSQNSSQSINTDEKR